ADHQGGIAVRGPYVTDPFPGTASGHDVVAPFKTQQIDRHLSRLAALTTLDLEDPAAPHAEAETGQPGDSAVHYVPSEPTRPAVMRLLGHRSTRAGPFRSGCIFRP